MPRSLRKAHLDLPWLVLWWCNKTNNPTSSWSNTRQSRGRWRPLWFMFWSLNSRSLNLFISHSIFNSIVSRCSMSSHSGWRMEVCWKKPPSHYHNVWLSYLTIFLPLSVGFTSWSFKNSLLLTLQVFFAIFVMSVVLSEKKTNRYI